MHALDKPKHCLLPVEPSPRSILVSPVNIGESLKQRSPSDLDKQYGEKIFENTFSNIEELDFQRLNEFGQMILTKKRVSISTHVEDLLTISSSNSVTPEMHLWEPVFTELQSSSSMKNMNFVRRSNERGSDISNQEHAHISDSEWIDSVAKTFHMADTLGKNWIEFLHAVGNDILASLELMQQFSGEFSIPFHLSKKLVEASSMFPEFTLHDLLFRNLDEVDADRKEVVSKFRLEFENFNRTALSRDVWRSKVAEALNDSTNREVRIPVSKRLRKIAKANNITPCNDDSHSFPIDVIPVVTSQDTDQNLVMNFDGKNVSSNELLGTDSCTAIFSESSTSPNMQIFLRNPEHNSSNNEISTFLGSQQVKSVPSGNERRYAVLVPGENSLIKLVPVHEKSTAHSTSMNSCENTLFMEH